MMSIHATPSAPSASAQPSQTQPAAAAQPALAAQAPAQAARGADAAQQAATPAPAFARVLGQQVEDSALAQAALSAVPATTSGTDGAAAADAGSGDGDGDGDGADSVTPDGTLLAAMAMPLMPLTPMQIAQAVQAAQGGAQAEQGKDPDAAAAGDAVGAVGQDAGRNKAISLPQLAAGQADQQINQQISQQISQQASGAARLAVQAHANNGQGNAGLDAGAQDGNADHAAAPATITVAAGAPVPASSAQPAADTVKLAGPPTAWRQSLQEALGDRLHLQVGKNIEQAVIRLEPPQLGRIDIAIRHSAGTLEVNISASNGEVLRQLQAVSDNLRGDLSQRQFTEVAVSVTPTPKNSNAAPFGDPQQQGRGRQQGRDQDEPGRALAEASNPTSVFSLGGRE